MTAENEKKKTYLREYEKITQQLKRSGQRIDEMRLDRIWPSVIMDGMPHASGSSDLSGYAAMFDQERRKYIKLRYLRLKKCKEISDKIERLENEDEKDVLLYRYIRRMKWEDICVKMNYSWQHVHRIHTSALNNFKM